MGWRWQGETVREIIICTWNIRTPLLWVKFQSFRGHVQLTQWCIFFKSFHFFPTGVNFFSCGVCVHYDTFCGCEMAHHASKAQTKPKTPWLMRKIVRELLNLQFFSPIWGLFSSPNGPKANFLNPPPYNPTIKLYTSLVNSWKPANFSLRYPWLGVMFLFTTDRGYHITLYRVKLPRIPRFYFAKIPWDGWTHPKVLWQNKTLGWVEV